MTVDHIDEVDDMDSEKCTILLSILKNGSMSAAAEELNYTQSGISRAVEALEKTVGFPILSRGRGGVRLTREGEELLPSMREMAYWAEQFDQTVQKLRGVQTGKLAVGSSYVKFFPWLTKIISGFHEKYPGITVELCSGTSTELASRMNGKVLDFGIISRRDGAFSSTVIMRDELVAMLPPEHPLASSASVPATIFETEPFIEIHTGLQTDNTLCFLDRGITPNLSFSTPDSFIACGMVKAGLGVALVNRVIADELSDAVAYVPLDPPEVVEICAVTPPDDVISPAARAFKAYFFAMFSEMR